MATVNASNVYIVRSLSGGVSPVGLTPTWRHRLAGTAYIDALPMVGIVVAETLNGPVIVGVTEVEVDGSFEITNIAQKYENDELVVFGISRTATDNYAIASRIKTVV